jgi:acyl-lipid omega-3 desaturase
MGRENYSYRGDILSDLPKLIEIKQAIPQECFQPIVLKSLYYVVKDTFLIVALYAALRYLEKLDLNLSLFFIIYPLYWFLQGTMFTSYFVLGHDCGHGSFSRYPILNDIMGNFLHTFILAPYYPWKITHRKHHNHTGKILLRNH